MSNPSLCQTRIPDKTPGDEVILMGLDFGSTTSSAMVASARVRFNNASGRSEFGLLRMIYRSQPVFTPFRGERIDLQALETLVDDWIKQSGIRPGDIFSGGAMVTGLAAQRKNSRALADLIREKIGDAVIATADDPSLESWLAFMGNCSSISRLYPEKPFINLDIGGGTTNPAYGMNDTVLSTGCFFVGARHFEFTPGTYDLIGISEFGRLLLAHLGVQKDVGGCLEPPEIDSVLDFYIDALEAMVAGDQGFFASTFAGRLQQVPFEFDAGGREPAILFSGGVGEMVYGWAAWGRAPWITVYGDLGGDLASRIVRSAVLSKSIKEYVPENQGRATVYGLTINSTHISGTTLFISNPETLPCRHLPIVSRVALGADQGEIEKALRLARKNADGACVQIVHAGDIFSLELLKSFAKKFQAACASLGFGPGRPLVLLAPGNYGQALGNYASDWRRSDVDLIVLDEIPDQRAHFVNIGRLVNQIVPVSFYGVH